MKTTKQIEAALTKIDVHKSNFRGMTFEQGLEEALQWVLGEIEDEDFSPLCDDS